MKVVEIKKLKKKKSTPTTTKFMWWDGYRGFQQARAVDVNVQHYLEIFCIIQTGPKRTYRRFLRPVWRIIGPLGTSNHFWWGAKLTFKSLSGADSFFTRAHAGQIVSTMTGTELTGVWRLTRSFIAREQAACSFFKEEKKETFYE